MPMPPTPCHVACLPRLACFAVACCCVLLSCTKPVLSTVHFSKMPCHVSNNTSYHTRVEREETKKAKMSKVFLGWRDGR